ncbi:bleomycin hydrolase [Collariella sp. IMI 366227]|nr:bleomycin hydrolase [Collariella sp. IMI 366227]
MGANQSRPLAELLAEKSGPEHLRNSKIESLEDGYVYINVEKKTNKSAQETQAILDLREPETVPVSRMTEWQDTLLKDPKNRLAISALNAASPKTVLLSPAAAVADQHVFNVKIPFEGGPITNQRQSGRCWLFASTNVFRVALMRKYGLESFELSQAYLFFWDKLEKSNWFLEQIIATKDMDLDSRLLQTMLSEPLSDGGQWDMVYNLVTKYGLIPQSLYPDSFSASSSSALNSLLFTKLREYALTLRTLLSSPTTTITTAHLSTTKATMLHEIHTLLTLTLGRPLPNRPATPAPVRTTPLAFAQDIYTPQFRVSSITIADMVSLVHDPRHPPLTLLTVDRLGNVVGGRGVSYINVDMSTLKCAFVMGDSWMDEFVYQAVVDPAVLSEEVRKVQEKEPVVLPLWDPMGSLA